jgi:hypothetical protein
LQTTAPTGFYGSRTQQISMTNSALSLSLAVLCAVWIGGPLKAQTFEVEPNDSPSTATGMSSGVIVSGQLISEGDIDHFALNVPSSGVLVLSLTGYVSSRKIDILSPSGVMLASYSNFFPSLSQVVAAPSAGRYLLRISALRPPYIHSTDQYYLRATFQLLTPTIEEPPLAQITALGGSATFSVGASGAPPITYQWRKDGVAIQGATSAKYYLQSAKQTDAGRYSVVVSNLNGAVSSGEVTLSLLDPPKLINLSTLGHLNPDLASGFVIRGAAAKRILARAVGPGLAPFGLSGLVADPVLELFDARGNSLRVNDDWIAADAGVFSSVGAFALPVGSRDSAMVLTLEPGNYIVSARGFRGATGLVLLEIYELP